MTTIQSYILLAPGVTDIENLALLPRYDKEKYKEMVFDAAETVLGFFGFDRTAYSDIKKEEERDGMKKYWNRELET